jgi:hypothetical protein
VKWGTPSEPAWAFQLAHYRGYRGSDAWAIASAYDAGRKSVVDNLLAAKAEGIQAMAHKAAEVLGGPVQLLDTVYDPAAHRLTFTWERK